LRLFDQGEHVLCLDNFFTGRIENFGSRYTELVTSGRFEIIRHDVIEPILLEVDRIYHLACPASPVHYQMNPVKTIKTNVLGTYHMLGLAKRVCARILLASTSEVYATPRSTRTRGLLGPREPQRYPQLLRRRGKRVAETLACDYHRQHKVQIRIAPHLQHVWPNMAINARAGGQQLHRPGPVRPGNHRLREGEQYAAASATSATCGRALPAHGQRHGGPGELGNDRELTILELVETIGRILGRR